MSFVKNIPLYTDNGYGCEDVDQRGYVSLMDLHESNYHRLRRLIPDLDALASVNRSQVEGCLDLHLKILDSTKYTSTLCMTYRFDDASESVFEPDIKFRIYHDAGLVEVLAGHLKHGRQKLNHVPAESLRLKWKLNRFLYKWLGFCLHQGHAFKPD